MQTDKGGFPFRLSLGIICRGMRSADMGKYKELTEKEHKFAKYRWEFLRRNPKYIKEWEELQDICGPAERGL